MLCYLQCEYTKLTTDLNEKALNLFLNPRISSEGMFTCVYPVSMYGLDIGILDRILSDLPALT